MRLSLFMAFVASLWLNAASLQAQNAAKPERIGFWKKRAPIGDGKFENTEAWVTVHRPKKSNGTAIVICPGGGYGGLVTGAEGHGIASWLIRHGITGVVLEYRLPAGRSQVPLLDAQRAIRTIRANAKNWDVDSSRIGIMGFSAGGHLASTAGTHFDFGNPDSADPMQRISCRPDFMILVYPVITMGDKGHQGSRNNLLGKNPDANLVEQFSNEKQVTADTPPTFLAHAKDDGPVPPANSRMFYEALRAKKVPAEYLELPSGGHGLNGYQGPMWDAWQEQSLLWLAKMKLAPMAASRNSTSSPAIGTRGMVSSAHPLATLAGLEILEAGGNAFDAAVTVAATLNVVEPMMSGMGGFGVILIYDAEKGALRCLDASGRFPAATNADVFRAPATNYLQNRKGAKAVSTPGNANAWEQLAKRHGKLPWPTLFAPAIKIADEGFIISERTAKHIDSEFPAFPEHAKAFYGKNGKPLQVGDRLVQKDLARSLRLLATQGARAIHGGELGEAIDKTMRETGGFLRIEDLKRNEAEWWDPVSIDYRGYQVAASPLPNNAWNGLYRLGIMSRFDVAKLGRTSPAYLHRYAEATKLAYAARLQHAGDRDHNPPPLDRLLSEKHWAHEAAKIKPNKALPLQAPPGSSLKGNEEEYTTHFVIADAHGNVVTSTQTLGMLFGSKMMVPGTGIWLNNSMQYCTFEPKGNPLDALPGRRKLAGFCPMLVMQGGKPWIAVGSPGGHTIVQTVPQIVMNMVDFRMDVQQAIAAPRLSFVEPDIIATDDGIPTTATAELVKMGHRIRVMSLGNAHGLTIAYDAKGRPVRFTGGADPRGEGAAMGR